MTDVVNRIICRGQEFEVVREWCKRILGDSNGWGLGAEVYNSSIHPVIVIFDDIELPLDHVDLLLALRWKEVENY